MSMLFNKPKLLIEIITQHTDCHIYYKNKNNNYRWCNKKVAEILNLEDEDSICGKSDYDLYDKDLADKVCKIDRKVLKRGEAYLCEEEGLDKDGRKAVYLSRKVPLFHNEKIVGLIGISMDITKIKQAEIAKEYFIMHMNHDIRTPFYGIVGVLSALESKENDPKKKELIKIGLMSSERLLSFMNDINNQVGHISLDYEFFDISQMAGDIVLFLEAAIQAKSLTFIKQCGAQTVYSNSFRIKHILLNLLGNAIKFTERGGVRLVINAQSNLTITVHDSGIGIDKKYHKKIFEEYFKVKPFYKNNDYVGVGKGLYLVKKYVEELQGKVTVQSAANEGSTFSVEIPLKHER